MTHFVYPTVKPASHFIQPGQEERVMSLHGKVVARTVTVVDVQDNMTYIRVLPTSDPSVYHAQRKHAFWANVFWREHETSWICSLNGPGSKSLMDTNHQTLKSALRRARRYVQTWASDPIPALDEWIHMFLPKVLSPFPTDESIARSIEYERRYFESVMLEAQHEDDAAYQTGGEPSYYDYEF